ncbi:ATPase [Stutzerimonas stutzeri]|uniref:ATPase n=1 Tax=Stutzerimonas stutzeri TaxID=316 RepID=A0A6I6LPQ9_STUST|nr:ATPase [Stutzerimonas stutzeri]QGZ31150.1 ATPase [Stutzerimonas stutzeri]
MSTRTPITRAYCVQLGEVLSIAEARRAFFSLPLPRSRFDFLCSNESCRDLATKAKITAVNYDKQPYDTYRAAHFRENNKYTHSPDCEWMIDEGAEEVDGKLPGEFEKDAFLRRARRKLHDYIDVFEPDAEQAAGGDSTGGAGEGGEVAGGNRSERVGQGGNQSRSHRTSSLERLVECYRQARQELSAEEFKTMKLQVVGEGEMPFSWFFKSISYAKLGASNRVLHGGASLVGRYGAGFKLRFYDRLDGKLVFLYVSKEQMGEYRFRRYLEEILQLEDADYFRVFALGELALAPSGKSINLLVSDLKKIVLIPGKKQTYDADAELAPAEES